MYFCLLKVDHYNRVFLFLFLQEFYMTRRKDQRSLQFNPCRKERVYVVIGQSGYLVDLIMCCFLEGEQARILDDFVQMLSFDLIGLFLILEASCNFNLALFLLQLLPFFQKSTQYSIFFFVGTRSGFLIDRDFVIRKDLFYVIFTYLYLNAKLGVRSKSVSSTCC